MRIRIRQAAGRNDATAAGALIADGSTNRSVPPRGNAFGCYVFSTSRSQQLTEIQGQGDAAGLIRTAQCPRSVSSDSKTRSGSVTTMWNFTAVVEKDADTGLYVGYVPGWPGAHSQGETMDELRSNLEEVISMLLEDGEPKLHSEFVGTQTFKVA